MYCCRISSTPWLISLGSVTPVGSPSSSLKSGYSSSPSAHHACRQLCRSCATARGAITAPALVFSIASIATRARSAFAAVSGSGLQSESERWRNSHAVCPASSVKLPSEEPRSHQMQPIQWARSTISPSVFTIRNAFAAAICSNFLRRREMRTSRNALRKLIQEMLGASASQGNVARKSSGNHEVPYRQAIVRPFVSMYPSFS
mmetsp:Transcript_39717/g.98391  ORF Transcript_39717/g.98391 Transcript_39717/m.98391 type:complete len:203 (-) Transcript_39717:403-1011(-)